MEKNFKNKVKDFFRKEGFYIVLFLCICIIATITAISYKMSNTKKEDVSNSTVKEELTLNNEDNITGEIPNAERVENNPNTNEVVSEEKVAQQNEESAAANATVNVEFTNPIEGSISREFSTTPIKYHETQDRVTYKTVKGIDIKASIGTEVKAAADGIVEVVLNDPSKVGVEDGVNIVILHTNGMRTKYSNLDSETLVKEGDKIVAGTVIGKVGSTAALFKEGFDEHLNLQVIDSNGQQVNPLEYFSY